MLCSVSPGDPIYAHKEVGTKLLYVAEFEDLDTGSIAGIGEAFEFCRLHQSARQIASRTASTLNFEDAGPERANRLVCKWKRDNNREKAKQTRNANQYSENMNVTRSQRTASSAAPAKKKTASNSRQLAAAKSKSQKKAIAQPSSEQVALRAYFIAERRRVLGIHGDETSDWVAAERELLEELKAK